MINDLCFTDLNNMTQTIKTIALNVLTCYFSPLGMIVDGLQRVTPTISMFISLNLYGFCTSAFLLLTQQPNVLRLQELLGAKCTADRAGVTSHRRHGRIQTPV